MHIRLKDDDKPVIIGEMSPGKVVTTDDGHWTFTIFMGDVELKAHDVKLLYPSDAKKLMRQTVKNWNEGLEDDSAI